MSDYIYYNGELYHASKKQHKYIKKEKVNGKWRYYYKDEDTGSKYGSYTDKTGHTYTVKKSNKWFSSTKEQQVEKVINNKKRTVTKVTKSEGRLSRFIYKAKKKVSKFLKKVENKKGNPKILKNGAKAVSKWLSKSQKTTIPKQHKYIKRIETASGKYLYFYDQAAYDRYLNKQKYLKNEPGFMKKVPKSTDRVMSKDEDMGDVNEKYSPYEKERSENCAYCTAAYELRSRGYDVQAAENTNMNSYLAKGKDYLEQFYENPDTIFLNEKGERDKSWKARQYDGTSKQKKTEYDMDVVENSIIKHSGKNTRGEFRVTWSQGGSHSMIYEVDGKGKVTIRDAQTNSVYNISEFSSGAHSVNRIAITRTDNLKLKKDVLKVVENNKTEVRDYEVRDGRVYNVNGSDNLWVIN